MSGRPVTTHAQGGPVGPRETLDLTGFARRLEARVPDFVGELHDYVEMESGSYDKEAVDLIGRTLSERFEKLGFEVERIAQDKVGDHLFARRRGHGSRRLFVLIHLDTVWPVGTLDEVPFSVSDGRAFGPGVLDMKGGWVVLLTALRELGSACLDRFGSVDVFMTSDEQLGSPSARSTIERLATGSDWALVMEPARESGALVTKRGAVGAVYVDITGINAHAMGKRTGASAIAEASHMILQLEALTQREQGLIVNVGTIIGGSARQVVPDRAQMVLDLRAPAPADADRLVAQVRHIVGHRHIAGTQATLTGGITRPAYAVDAACEPLFEVAKTCGAELDLPIKPEGTRGGSDGNFTAGLGIPTLDGLGPEGANGCTRDEYVLVESFPRRTALLAGIIDRLAQTPAG